MAQFFDVIKALYIESRRQEWGELRRFLRKRGLTVLRGGKGSPNYKGKLKTSYDLSCWLWIEVKIDDVIVFISFQPFDTDPRTSNQHALFDRIGISYYLGEYNKDDILAHMEITDIDLPLNDDAKERIYNLIQATAQKAVK